MMVSIPEMLIWITGMAFAWHERRSYPVRSRLAIIGFAVLLLTGPIFSIINVVVSDAIRTQPFGSFDVSTIFMIIGLARGVAIVIGGAFLIAALFGVRANKRKEIDRSEME